MWDFRLLILLIIVKVPEYFLCNFLLPMFGGKKIACVQLKFTKVKAQNAVPCIFEWPLCCVFLRITDTLLFPFQLCLTFDIFLDDRSILSVAVPIAVFVVLAGFVITALLYKRRSNKNIKLHKKTSAALATLQTNPLYQTLYVNMWVMELRFICLRYMQW